ncbi:MAG: hypothetical protein M1819_007310 [Sarea resinae]|nr:MAG: hypothetical protein M1819_007310 [Sarea resinae]
MASPSDYQFEHFNVAFPAEYVVHVEINRPQKLNAFDEPMWLELRTIFDRLSQDPNVRAVVLSGAGPKAFTAGLDVQYATQSKVLFGEGEGGDSARTAQGIRRYIAGFQDCISSIERCEKPVIAILHGHTIGLGIDISCCADIRLCAARTTFSVKEVDIGLAADIGTLTRLPKVVGAHSWVKDVSLTARAFDAPEALRVGFVSAVLDDKAAALAEGLRVAGVLAAKSPVAVQGTKELLNYSRDHSTADGLRYTGVWNSAAVQTPDVKEAITAGLARRKPSFAKL